MLQTDGMAHRQGVRASGEASRNNGSSLRRIGARKMNHFLPAFLHSCRLVASKLLPLAYSSDTFTEGAEVDVAGWLRSLGLGRCRGGLPRQRHRGGGSATPDGRRPHVDRRDLGGSSPKASFGCCRSGLGFAKACGGCGAGEAAPVTRPVGAARRQLTVMFCDLVEFDSDCCTARPGGSTRGDFRVPERGQPAGRTL